jgi:uncharacterized protein
VEHQSGADGQPVTVVETHVSTLFFTADRVFKLKKAVATGFLDFRDPAARREACHREVELNRRLAPDVYLGVADLSLDGEELDYFVVMRRLPPARRLSAVLDEPVAVSHLERIAELVAGFHATAERGPAIDEAASPDALIELWRTGVQQLAPFVPEVLSAEEVEHLWSLAQEYLQGRRSLVEDRVAAGRACDGHGDLLAEDIFCMDDGPRILDCLEFDDHLRYGDVLADVAFLAMDLERLGRADLARHFMTAYLEASGDHWPESLAHVHVAYRAHVRSKVACIRHAQGDPEAAGTARALHAIALDHLQQARVLLVIVGGAPGTGKSTLAGGLSGELGALLLSSDDLRAEVVPGAAGEPRRLHEQRYAPDRVDAVYAELLSRAQRLLAEGHSVVLDASWASARQRVRARELAAAGSAELVELCCSCAPDVAAARIEARIARGGSNSEVTTDIAATLASERDPWPEAVMIETSHEPAEVRRIALTAVRAAAKEPPWRDAGEID